METNELKACKMQLEIKYKEALEMEQDINKLNRVIKVNEEAIKELSLINVKLTERNEKLKHAIKTMVEMI
jgi:hypothetical protein